MARVLLLNLNRIDVPLVAPYALDVLASTLTASGHDVELLDLNLEPDALGAVAAYGRRRVPDMVGVTLRNTGDLYFPSWFDQPTRGSYLESHAAIIDGLKCWMPANRIVIGGVGFSSNPIPLLQRFGLTCGVVGPGDAIVPRMAEAIDRRIDLAEALAPWRLPSPPELLLLGGTKGPLATGVRRRFVDNRRYYDEGGLAGVRTSNGCAMNCGYCVEPLAKGKGYLRRTVDDVVEEIDQLLAAGIFDIHTCDSEFNMPIDHAKQVLRAIAARSYPRRLRFWTYCQPKPFDAALAGLMAEANVAGVNFGIDHTDPAMLRRLGKTWYTLDDIQRATGLCHAHGIAVNHEFLFGYPADTPAAMFKAIDEVLALDAHAMGIVVGLAVLPGTGLARLFQERRAAGAPREGFYLAGEPLIDPMFFVDPSFDVPEIFERLRRHVGSEIRRVMMPHVNSTAADSNQLVGSQRVKEDLANGKRGAYWFHYPSREHATGPASPACRHAPAR